MVSPAVLDVRLPSGEYPTCGVLLEPYIVYIGEGAEGGLASIPDEFGPANDCPGSRLRLRSRWFRQVADRHPSCCVHPDRKATVQCVLCVKRRVPVNLSYQCDGECLQRNWRLHQALHEEYQELSEDFGDALVAHGQPNGFPSNWRINTSHYRQNSGDGDWLEICQARSYTPSADDLGCKLKLECCLVDTYALAPEETDMTVVETAVVQPAPSPLVRAMLPLQRSNRAYNEGRFTLLTYNILADLYVSGDKHQTDCPLWALSWHYRKVNLMKEVSGYCADVICLQEVQSNHYYDFLKQAMEEQGYNGVFKRKTCDVYSGDRLITEGCAIFYQKDRFKYIKKYEVEFKKAAGSCAEKRPEPQKTAIRQRLCKDNVSLMVILELIEPVADSGKQLICIANTHIHANPDHADVKLWQVHTLLKGLETISASAEIPIIVAGDLNSEPGSAPHKLLLHGTVDSTHPDTANDPTQLLQTLLPISHNLDLQSAYSSMLSSAVASIEGQQGEKMDCKHREPKFTSWTNRYKGTLDYIFYSPESLHPVSLLEMPSMEDIHASKDSGIPNSHCSSDHIALLAEFQLNPK